MVEDGDIYNLFIYIHIHILYTYNIYILYIHIYKKKYVYTSRVLKYKQHNPKKQNNAPKVAQELALLAELHILRIEIDLARVCVFVWLVIRGVGRSLQG